MIGAARSMLKRISNPATEATELVQRDPGAPRICSDEESCRELNYPVLLCRDTCGTPFSINSRIGEITA